jgi:hypothetical protein
MQDNNNDRTIERNYLQKWHFLIPEYEAVKAGRSETYRRIGDFYRHHGTCSQTFRKYCNRYLASGTEDGRLAYAHFPFTFSPCSPRADLRGLDGIKAFNASAPVVVMRYVQPKVLSRLRCSQPLASIPKIVDGPAG